MRQHRRVDRRATSAMECCARARGARFFCCATISKVLYTALPRVTLLSDCAAAARGPSLMSLRCLYSTSARRRVVLGRSQVIYKDGTRKSYTQHVKRSTRITTASPQKHHKPNRPNHTFSLNPQNRYQTAFVEPSGSEMALANPTACSALA